ncbi:MAG: hypothetical protein ACLUOF_09965 [Ruminococcus sp.]
MMKIKGVNVFPNQIEEIGYIREISSEYQIRFHLDGKDTMRIYVESTVMWISQT